MDAKSRYPQWKRRAAVLTPPAILALFVLVLVAAILRGRASTDAVEHAQETILTLHDLQVRLLDAETGQRGYIITGDTTYLGPYLGAAADIRHTLSRLSAESGTAERAKLVAALDSTIERRLTILDGRIAIRRAVGFEAAREAVIAGGGKEAMDRVRDYTSRLGDIEAATLARRNAEQERDGWVVLVALLLGSVVVGAVSVLTNRLFRREAAAQAELNERLGLANQQLHEQAVELELQAEELQSQSAQLEETLAQLQSAFDEVESSRGQLEELAAELEASNEELQNTNELLEERTAAAEEANRAKTEFLASMSHELRTPLNAIAGYVDLLDLGVHGMLSETQRNSLDRIRRNGRHLLGLINDILYYAKIQAGRLDLRMQSVEIGELMEESEPLLGPLFRAKGLDFTVDAGSAPLEVRGDPDRIRQVLLNLLSNAVKYTDPGGHIEVRAERFDGEVEVRVADSGCGIPADKMEVIFDPFVQLTGQPGAPMRQGAGLGLSISRELARAMGGDLTVSSTPGDGSVFTLRLRLAAEHPVAHPHRRAADTDDAGPVAAGN